MTIEDLDGLRDEDGAEDEGAASGAEAEGSAAPPRRSAEDGPDPELVLAFSPRQILGGFALLAALVMLLRRRNRGSDPRDRD